MERHNALKCRGLTVCVFLFPIQTSGGDRQEETYKLKTLTSPRQDGKGKKNMDLYSALSWSHF